METYNRDELLDYLTAREMGIVAAFETPDSVKQRYTKAWTVKRKYIDTWLKQLENKEHSKANVCLATS